MSTPIIWSPAESLQMPLIVTLAPAKIALIAIISSLMRSPQDPETCPFFNEEYDFPKEPIDWITKLDGGLKEILNKSGENGARLLAAFTWDFEEGRLPNNHDISPNACLIHAMSNWCQYRDTLYHEVARHYKNTIIDLVQMSVNSPNADFELDEQDRVKVKFVREAIVEMAGHITFDIESHADDNSKDMEKLIKAITNDLSENKEVAKKDFVKEFIIKCIKTNTYVKG
ncbi:uncharacterized protein ATNIH1004_001861 [Aspergillus tanneri]|uniref:Uncharacterized protein n=1 Tax=Aspergillus tanneri TaxID=1220188 RepID=A0A5M9M738_9EURO|nr:uncharacterized protein ATNIH1004_001861 [Aspergillus tanneri]KAA8641396.1 hypothetical protein ATNIH1004_001861 [Aspergillus tanneri]